MKEEELKSIISRIKRKAEVKKNMKLGKMNEEKLKELLEKMLDNMDALKDAFEDHEHNKDGAIVSSNVVKTKWEPVYYEYLKGDYLENGVWSVIKNSKKKNTKSI